MFTTWAPIRGFDTVWMLAELKAALEVSEGKSTETYRLTEWLAETSETEALGAVGVLNQLSNSDRIERDLLGQANAARAVIRAAVEEGGKAACIARKVASRLTVRTHIDFTSDLPVSDNGQESD